MENELLDFIWYLVICASVMFYTVLDGFDLGVGMLQPFAKSDRDRRIFLNAIGPIWDGNEVWLVIVGGATFAGFPRAYAAICSIFYTPIMILLCGLIFRAVAIEFRSKVEHAIWRHVWDYVFAISSFVMTFVLGVLLGNLVQGVNMDAEGNFFGTFWDFFTPYTVLIGITAVLLFVMHGTIFLFMKTEGELHLRLKKWIPTSIAFFVIAFFLTTVSTLIHFPFMADVIRDEPFLYIIAALAFLVMANIPREVYKGNDWRAFLSSCMSIALLFVFFGIGTFPTLLRSSLDPQRYSITIYNAGSSETTLLIILIIAAIGVPLVLAYGYWIYRIFRGKVTITDSSY